jgi:ribosomal protein L40E
MPMNPIAEKRYLKDKWVCMSCNATMRGPKKPVSCRKCGATKIRQKKKQRKK